MIHMGRKIITNAVALSLLAMAAVLWLPSRAEAFRDVSDKTGIVVGITKVQTVVLNTVIIGDPQLRPASCMGTLMFA